MLSKFDDYAIHQTPEPLLAPASSDRNVYDRYWLNGYADDGEFYFGIGMAVYPHRHILDGAFSLVIDGEQHAFFASRRAPRDRDEIAVGPFEIQIVEPMKTLRVTLAANDSGLECDLVFRARTAAVEEGRQTTHRDGRIMMDATRFAQFGRWEGEVRYRGRSIEIVPSRVLGTKDRSWGLRPIGEPDAGGAPSGELPQFFFLWNPIHWKDSCTHFGLFEESDGRRWHEDAVVIPAYDGSDAIPSLIDANGERLSGVRWDIEYQPGTRWAQSAHISLGRSGGDSLEIELEPLLKFQMKGLGYTSPEWGHGQWKGELFVDGRSWKCDELDPLAFDNLHVQQVVRARMGEEEGIGVLEQIVIGPHEPSGFQEFLDGAK